MPKAIGHLGETIGLVAKRLDRGLAAVEASLVGLCLIGGAALNFAVIAARYLFNLSLSGFEEISVYFLIWMTFVGMVVADRGRQHITIDIVQHIAPEAALPWLERISDFAKALISLTLAWLSYDAARFSFVIDERAVTALETPIWIVMAVMAPAFFLLGLRNLARALATAPRSRPKAIEGSS